MLRQTDAFSQCDMHGLLQTLKMLGRTSQCAQSGSAGLSVLYEQNYTKTAPF